MQGDEDRVVAVATGGTGGSLETLACIEQRKLKAEGWRGQKKGRPLPGWVRLPVTYSKAVWRQDGEAKPNGKNPLSCPL